MNAPSKPETLDDVITDRYEADSLATVADRLHNRLVDLGWELPNMQFYVHREGSTFSLEYMLNNPVLSIQHYRMAVGAEADAVKAITTLPMLREPHDLPPYAGLITSVEYWCIEGVPESREAELLHPIWRNNLEMHPRREDARRTRWATPDGRNGIIRTRRTGDKFAGLADSDLGFIAAAYQEVHQQGIKFSATKWKSNSDAD